MPSQAHDAAQVPEKAAGGSRAESLQCPLCGHNNSPENINCASCGATLPGKSKPISRPRKEHLPAGKSAPLNPLQSWKLTASIGVILVVVLVAVKLSNGTKEEPKPALPNDAHQNSALIAELETLEKAVKANPNDAPTMLQLANHLQDAKFLPKAIEAYQHYLDLKPDDPNATVDMGVTYYELSMTDTLHRDQHLQSADERFHSALKINPKHQLAHFNLGIVNLMRGDLMTANEWFKKTAAIDSTTETGKRAQMLIHQHSFKNNPSTQQ